MWRILALGALLWAGAPALAQDQRVFAPIVTLNQERLYASSLFGERVRRELEEASVALAAENRRIEATLIAEERQLTEDRVTLDPQEFRALAVDFDERVTEIRAAQAEKRDALQATAEAERARFFELVYPILSRMANEQGALAILDQSAVILSSRSIDITALAVARINSELGAAPQPETSPTAPAPRPGSDGTDESGSTND